MEVQASTSSIFIMLEQWCLANGRPASDVGMMRVDELAQLGCCCFCSILLIGNEDWVANHPKETAAFMRAVKKGADFMHADPVAAWAKYCEFKPVMNTRLNALQYERSYNYMSKDLSNVMRDWIKVTNYSRRLGILPDDYKMNMTNVFITWEYDSQDNVDADAKQEELCCKQRDIANFGGLLGITSSGIKAAA